MPYGIYPHLHKTYLELKNKKFVKLTVIRRVENDKFGSVRLLCECDCGKELVVFLRNLNTGSAKSCKTCRVKPEQAATNQVFSIYKRGAKHRKLVFKLTREYFAVEIKKVCHYCGSSPLNLYRVKKNTFVYNGLDRKDNSVGYTKENCVPCCKHCNRAKRNMSYEDFTSWLTRASVWIVSKGK